MGSPTSPIIENLQNLRFYTSEAENLPRTMESDVREVVDNLRVAINDASEANKLTSEEWDAAVEIIRDCTTDVFAKQFRSVAKHVKTVGLLSTAEGKRRERIEQAFAEEEAQAREAHERFVKAAPAGRPSQDEILEHLQQVRSSKPRLFLTIQDEGDLLREVAEELSPGECVENIKKAASRWTLKSLLEGAPAQLNATGNYGITLQQARIPRLRRLYHLEETYQRIVADPSRHVTNKFFPKAYALYIAAQPTTSSGTFFEWDVKEHVEKHGVKIVTDTRIEEGGDLPFGKRPDFFIEMGGSSLKMQEYSWKSPWSQDFIDFCPNGEVRFPRARMGEEIGAFEMHLLEEREKRDWRREDLGHKFYIGGLFPPVMGHVFTAQNVINAVQFSSACGATPIMNLTYSEGGNALMGMDQGKPYMIVGKDSYAATQYLMEKDLDREVSDVEIRMAFGIDYGIEKENIFFVEQPGDFHLDMSMAIIGEKTILLNDSEAAQRAFQKEQGAWLASARVREPENEVTFAAYVRGEEKAVERRKQLEDKTEEQLRSFGFNVIRVAGSYHYHMNRKAMNLFNFVTMETPGGKNVILMNGCISGEYEQAFTQVIEEHCDRRIDEIIFLDETYTSDSLSLNGGIACRTKVIPLV